jgi:hypothetical protein
MHGLFFEDINYAADGGLYAELVQNRSFEHRDRLFSWSQARRGGGEGTVAVALMTRSTPGIRITSASVSAPPGRASGSPTAVSEASPFGGAKNTVSPFTRVATQRSGANYWPCWKTSRGET